VRFLGFLLRRVSGSRRVIGVLVITFAISHVIPADPVAAALGDHATDAQIAQFRAEYASTDRCPSSSPLRRPASFTRSG